MRPRTWSRRNRRHARLRKTTGRTNVHSRLCRLIGAALLAFCAAYPAAAQDFPSRPIRMVIAFPAGGPTDFVGRLLADKLKDTLGQVIIENKPGANGAIGADYVAKSRARRLHAVPHHGRRGRDHAQHAQGPALRRAAGLRAGDARGAQHHRAGGARRQPGQLGQGIRRIREVEERRLPIRHDRGRLDHAPCDRTVRGRRRT